MSDYVSFLASKRRHIEPLGVEIHEGDVHPWLHAWQNQIVRWAVKTGRAAVWADTGLGKTVMQVEWARLSGARALIVAPLAVCQQTVREAAKIGVAARYVRSDAEAVGPGVWVTNYEMVTHFDPALLDAVVLDEASILKQSDGKTRTLLIKHFASVPYRLACTATPAPNDIEELTNQAEFLGVSTRVNMLAAYFVHDSHAGWRMKGHARGPMFTWMASWAVALRRPSDIGYDDAGYILPPLRIVPELLPVDVVPEGQLFATDLGGVGGRANIRRQTLQARVARTVEIVNDCGSHGIQSRVLPEQQGQVGTFSGGEDGTQPKAARAVQRESSASREDAREYEGVQAQATAAADGHDVRADGTRAGTDAGPRLSDLPCHARSESWTATPRRPQSHDRHGARCSLSGMQHGIGSVVRGSNADHVDVSVSHACRDQWLIWVGLNAEQDALAKAFGSECVSIDGRIKLPDKIELERRWREGEVRVLVTKPDVFMYGMNWQHCHRMAFVGLSDSYEQYYQAIRRCYRYGQTNEVHAHVILSTLEAQIASNIARKERESNHIHEGLVAQMSRATHWGVAA